MSRFLKTTASILATGVLLTSVASASANVCNEILASLPSVRHGSIAYRDDSGNWQLLVRSRPADSIGTKKFYYVLKDPARKKGMLVVKSARPAESGETADNTVSLLRLPSTDPQSESCYGGIANNPVRNGSREETVKLDGYERYHRYGDNGVSDVAKMRNFHVVYESDAPKYRRLAEGRRCIRTDDNNASRVNSVSNRNRFSFDRSVVDRGASAFRAVFSSLVRPVLAFEGDLKDMKVRMLPFSVSSAGVACVPFSVTGIGGHSILRVQDIDDVDGAIRRPELRINED